MPPDAAAALKTVSLTGQNKTAVVVGGTLGIGAGVARLLAKLGCSRVVIVGRDEIRGTAMLATLKHLAPSGSKIAVDFIKADVSDKKGIRAAAEAIQHTVGDAGIDYLVMTQNGVPKGAMVPNADGIDTPFAIQCLSRFGLAYLLTTRGALAPTGAAVMSICSTGRSLDDLDAADLTLATRTQSKSVTALFMDQSKRDSTVIDSFTEELNTRYPTNRYYTLWPGLVKSEQFSLSKFPGFIKLAMWVGLRLIGTTPDQYANIPVYILASPDAPHTLGETNRRFDYKLNPSECAAWAQDAGKRAAVWGVLGRMLGEEAGE
ncbi:hypothetical protein C8R46DRAFT_1196650 [Mycena filopes]|nr:hypothetical protein C8R46DRAFT_1196650 [Mycena filopes]